MPDSERNWRLADIPYDQLDGMPFGAVVVEYDGTIVAYNHYEARLAHKDAQAVIGRNFFHDVAPCTAVKAFEGRMKEFTRSKERVSEAFDYFFPFAHGAVDVSITFVKLTGKEQILIAIERVDKAPDVASV